MRSWGWALPEDGTESARLPAWLNVEENAAAQVSVPSHFEQPVQPETNEPARDARQRCELEPDEVVPRPGGGWTWKRLLERSEDQSTAKVETLVAAETRLPES